MKYCFHHVPKTAGSTLQLRICHREWIGELPKGSTLVASPYGNNTFYRVKDDINFNPNEPIRNGFERLKGHRGTGNATIVMGHLTNVNQAGDHYTWLRHPLERDISYWKYDLANNKALSSNFETHIKKMPQNFYLTWFWKHYMGRTGGAKSIEDAYNQVCNALSNFKRIYDHNKFEDSWDEIANLLHISKEPRLNTNISKKSSLNISQNFKKWHEENNEFDYEIYRKFIDNWR